VLVPSFQNVADFKLRYSDWVPTNEGRKRQGELWLESAHRAKYDMIVFRRGARRVVVSKAEGITTTMLNSWRGWPLMPKAGVWRLLHRHIVEILANGNEAFAEYTLNWTAHGYQRPGIKRGVALVFQGHEGVGKGVFGHALRRSYGSHGLYVAQPSQLVGKFNKHLWTICFLFADEAFFRWG
jgi:hypothetical protein